ncbi:hypothetical protein JCM18909_2524 [Cutibacterium acnes JCM 18909]|nr:hypothetical protein JCM18909_2524 [Cutibacterium acnes JCM 18909]
MSVAERTAARPLDRQEMASRATSGVWLGAVAAVLVMRLPMGFFLFLIVPWVILAVQTRFASSLRVTPLVAVEVCCMVASGMAVALFPSRTPNRHREQRLHHARGYRCDPRGVPVS